MTLQDFQARWLGKRVDQDGVFGYQCVDLIKQYAKEVLGMTPGAWGNAIDYWKNTNHPLLSKYTRVASQSPQRGDIVILNGTAGNPYGHIGIATDSNTMLEQNGATGDGDGQGGDEVRYRTIPKTRIAGLLRPKGGNTVGTIPNADNYYNRYRKAMQRIRGRDMGRTEFNKNFVGNTDLQMLEAMLDNKEADTYYSLGQWAKANKTKLEAELAREQQYTKDVRSYWQAKLAEAETKAKNDADAANARIVELEGQIKDLGEKPKSTVIDVGEDTRNWIQRLIDSIRGK